MSDSIEQITDSFMSDFRELLRKYDATFELEVGDYDSWAVIDFNSIWDENHEQLRPYINFQLPNYIRPI